MIAELSERDNQILQAVIEEFIATAEPVGSRNLTKKYALGVSPATVRNVMADLEELGLLTQPHTSAGRQPTDLAYRYYVDHLMGSRGVRPDERRRLRRHLAGASRDDVEELLDTTCRALSSMAHLVGLVAAPRFEARVFRHIDFVLLRPGRVLVVLVSESGAVYHRPVDAPEVDDQARLDRMGEYLNHLLEGLPLSAVRDRILAEMESERAAVDALFHRALTLGDRALRSADRSGDSGVFVGDPGPLLEQPEFHSPDRLKGILETFEKKGLLIKLLDRACAEPGVQVVIGRENPSEDLQGCSVVVSNYGSGDRVLGSLGVIGPTRMPYPRVVALVDYTARLLGETLGPG